MSQEQNKKRPMMGHGPGRGMMPGEKAKNFTGTIQKLFAYLGSYRIVLGVVILFAIGSTVFNVIGPKVLSKVTTELFNGLVAKVSGTGGIDFEKIGRILLLLLGIYCISAVFNFIQGWLMTGVTQKLCYRMRKEISEKINRMPMKYFESRTVGKLLLPFYRKCAADQDQQPAQAGNPHACKHTDSRPQSDWQTHPEPFLYKKAEHTKQCRPCQPDQVKFCSGSLGCNHTNTIYQTQCRQHITEHHHFHSPRPLLLHFNLHSAYGFIQRVYSFRNRS